MPIKAFISLLTLILIFILETFLPYFKNRKNRLVHGLNNIVLSLFNGMLYVLFFSGLTLKVIKFSVNRGIGMANNSPFPGPVKSIIVFLLFDLWMYFWHRINHRISILWLFHRVHHTDREMDVTTANRFHPLEILLSSFLRLAIILIIGMNFSQFILYGTVLIIVIMFHHSNIALPEKYDRIIRSVIVSPNMHRVHHSEEWYETNSNFSSIFSFWDRIGRTFRKRRDILTIKYGLKILKEKKWQNLTGMLKTPFKNFSFKGTLKNY